MILKGEKRVWQAKWSFKISIANLGHLPAIASLVLFCLGKGTDQLLQLWKQIACISDCSGCGTGTSRENQTIR